MRILKEFPLDFKKTLSPREKGIELGALVDMSNRIISDFFFDLDSPAPEISINGRLTRSNGRYFPTRGDIELSGVMIKAAMLSENFSLVEKVLKHELAHWYLHKKGLPYNDGEEGFEKLLLEIGSISSSSTKTSLQYVSSSSRESFDLVNIARCKRCGEISVSNRKLNGNYIHSGECAGLLIDESIALVVYS